ncbi:E3 ubiquitin-protein ligase TRIM71-like [Glandiceps talaboti]
MADSASKFLDEINENFLLCAICTEPYRNAKLLPCLHSFCQPCLDQLFRRSSRSTIKCPLCLREHTVPPGGVTDFSTFFFMNQLVDRFNNREQVLSDGQSQTSSRTSPGVDKCGACDGECPKNHCIDCDVQLCDTCTRGHKRLRSTKSHTLMSLEEYQAEKSKNPASVQPPIYCSRHPDVPLKFYCDSCEVPICSECTVVEHSKSKHKVRSMSDAADDYMRYLAKMLEKMRMKEDEATASEIAVQQMSESLDECFESEEKKIKDLVEKITRTIENSGRKLLTELKGEYDNRKITLQAQSKELNNVKNDLTNARELTENLMQYGNAAQLMTARRGMLFQMHELMAIKTTCTQTEADSIEFKPNDDVIYLKSLGVVKVTTQAKVHDSLQVLSIRRHADDSRSQTRVTSMKGLVWLFGEKGKRVGQFGDYLHGVSMTTKGGVLVSDPDNHRLQTFTLQGKQPRGIQFSGFSKPVKPQFTAVTKEGHIFVTDGDNKQVFECNENGKLIRFFDKANLKNPLGIAVNSNNGRVYVVDNGSHCVHIYRINGKYIKLFASQGSGSGRLLHPWCVCIDYNTGNVIVSDAGNNQLNVYTENGNYLFTFGNDPNKEGQCKCPFGVATDKAGNVYVCNHYGNNVMKYDPHGNIMSRVDSDQDNLESPVGICLTDDKPYKIVVSENYTGHIKVFAQ